MGDPGRGAAGRAGGLRNYPNTMAKDLPTSRVRRAAKVGRLAGTQTARGYATKAANLTRGEEGRRAAAERRQMEAAEQIFDVLGQMKGAAMKVGQVASFIDTGGFPPSSRSASRASWPSCVTPPRACPSSA